MGPENPPPPARGGRLDNPAPARGGRPLDDRPPANPADDPNGPRASVDDPSATIAAGDIPALPPISLANEDAAGSIDPVPSAIAAEVQPQPAAPAAGSIPAASSARPPQRRGFLSALIGRIRRG